jgi:hypothetical protein
MQAKYKVAFDVAAGFVLGAALSSGDWHRSRHLARARHHTYYEVAEINVKGQTSYEKSGVTVQGHRRRTQHYWCASTQPLLDHAEGVEQ